MNPSDAFPDRDDPVLGLPFDQFERYSMTQRVVELLWPSGRRPLRVLDVGGNSSPLKHLLPNDEVVLTDIEPPGSLRGLPLRFDRYVQASGAGLPFPDGSFDVVAAHDTLEHVPGPYRTAFLDELVRVSRRLVVVNGPVYHPHTVRAERLLARFLGRGPTDEGRFIREHLQLGLPDREEIETQFRDRGLPFASVPNGRLAAWLGMHLARQLASLLPSDRFGEGLDRVFNVLLAPTDFHGLCYRDAYVVSKRTEDAGVLESARTLLGPGVEAPVQADADAVAEGLAILEEYVESMPEHPPDYEPDRAELERRLRELQARHDRIARSVGFRTMDRLARNLNRVAPWGTRRRSLFLAPARAARVISASGWGAFFRHLLRPARWGPRLVAPAFPPVEQLTPEERYELWMRLRMPPARQLRALRAEARRLPEHLLFSVLAPVHGVAPGLAAAAIASLRSQAYPRWELVMAAEEESDELEVIRAAAREDQRIRPLACPPAEGWRAALAAASGPFVAVLSHAELRPSALLEVAKAMNEQRDIDVLYADEDSREPGGRPGEPFFKPDWSPDYLLSTDYLGRFVVYRRELLEQVGGFRHGFDGSEPYDLALRATEVTDRIAQIPLPLATGWREPRRADDVRAQRAAKRALADALQRRGHAGEVHDDVTRGFYRVRYEIGGHPKVSIVIPTRDKVDLLRRCVESIERRSTYTNYELIVVDNDSREPRTLRYLESLPGPVIRYPHEFNFSTIVNLAASEASGAFLVFLNNDTEVITPGWIEAMLEHAQRPHVAAVGARLLFPDGSPQHEGIIVGPGRGLAENVDHGGYFGLGRVVHNVSAVTAACMMTRPDVFWELGGFEEHLRVAYNDVDFCLRAREKGYLVVYTPYATLYHDEGSTRARFDRMQPVEDEEFFRKRWSGHRDPYYNPNLDLTRLYAPALRR